MNPRQKLLMEKLDALKAAIDKMPNSSRAAFAARHPDLAAALNEVVFEHMGLRARQLTFSRIYAEPTAVSERKTRGVPWVLFVCPYCNTSRHVSPTIAKTMKYCSRSCAQQARTGKMRSA